MKSAWSKGKVWTISLGWKTKNTIYSFGSLNYNPTEHSQEL